MPVYLKAPAHHGRGPDGQGWNRLSVTGGASGPGDQCALQPRDWATLRESLDTRRAAWGGYGHCTRAGECDGCPVYRAEPVTLSRPGEDRVLVRVDAEGRPCVMVSPDTGWDGRYYIKPWRWLRRLEGWDIGDRADDEHGQAFWLIRDEEPGGEPGGDMEVPPWYAPPVPVRQDDGMDLVTFLRARLDEDEQVTYNPAFMPVTGPGLSDLVKRGRAEVEAKRRVVNHWPDPFGNWSADQADAARAMKEQTLRYLATAYKEHPEYREEWKP